MAQAVPTEVRFRAAFETPQGQDPSRLLADFVAGPLSTFRIRCSAPREADEGSTVQCVVGERHFELLVLDAGEQDGEWRISIRSGLGWIRRKLRARDDAELLHLTRALHKVLADGERIHGISWHGIEELAARPDQRWWDQRQQQS